jgi:hypothetical protein
MYSRPQPQVECPAVTPEIVLKASGHVDRFTDFMVTDLKTGEQLRLGWVVSGDALSRGGRDPSVPAAAGTGGHFTPFVLNPVRTHCQPPQPQATPTAPTTWWNTTWRRCWRTPRRRWRPT